MHDHYKVHDVRRSCVTRAIQTRRAVADHEAWITEKLGVPMEQTVILDLDVSFRVGGLAKLTGFLDPGAPASTITRRLREVCEAIETPPGAVPFLNVCGGREDDDSPLANATSLPMSLDWLDGPFALRLRGLTSPVVTVRFGYFTGPSTRDEKHGEVVLIPKTQIRPFLSFVKELQKPDGQPRLRTAWDEPQTLTPLSWEDLILDDNITNVLRSDFDAFFKREAWFKSMRLPFRRGYLLHGPPGNGKSSAVRAMLTSRGMTAHTLRLFQDNTDDGALDRLFNLAAQNAPAMILLEDIDRAFPRTGARTKISLQNLLNRLDGVASGDGVAVVATANEPTALDPAILKRPGRFDRVVLFPNPKPELRRRYFKHLNPEMGSENLDFVVSTSDGFSFAQLREAYIMAGQIAFTENREVLMGDLIWAVHTLRRSTLTSSLRGKVAGFTSDKEALPSA